MTIQCELCPKYCVISKGQSGDCRIRVNLDDKLIAVTYGHPCTLHVDPVEKKPLFHFYPGSQILSIATVGCNLHCKNCQNWEISQANPADIEAYSISADKITQIARDAGTFLIAYTYTEPLAYYEYTLDMSVKAKEKGIKNVLVTAGYLNEAPLKKLFSYTDAATIDIKSFTDKFYREICNATLKPVLNTLIIAKKMGLHLEISYLLIPTLNDSEKEIKDFSRWIRDNCGADTPLHFLRFYPQYRMNNLPPTSSDSLERARAIAQSEGLYHIYIGNTPTREGENTYCPKCEQLLIERKSYSIFQNHIIKGRCEYCKTEINGKWI